MGSKLTEREWEQHQFPYENKGSNSLQAYVLKRLKTHYKNICAVKVMKANQNGTSDILMCIRGRFVAVELKVRDNPTTLKQMEFLTWVARCGGIAKVAYTWGEFKAALRAGGYDFDEEEEKIKAESSNKA